MATTPEQLAVILDALDPLPVSAKRMFGEYALYLDGRIPGFVMDGVLALKITDVSDDRLTPEHRGPIYPRSKDYWRIPPELLDDRDWLLEFVQETTALVQPQTPKKPRKGIDDA